MNAHGACRSLMYRLVPLRDTSRQLLGNRGWLARVESEKTLKQVDRRLLKGSRRELGKIRADITKGIHYLLQKLQRNLTFGCSLQTWTLGTF